jgi:L-alanine-DL-glutamate epimerase-like enolase superfamily enzyme
MMNNRRDFFKTAGLAAGAFAFSGIVPGCSNLSEKTKNWKEMPLTLRFRPYELKLRHVFTLATSSRKTTPDILTELEWNGIIGYGEASLPPYLAENQDSVSKFLSQLDLTKFTNPFLMEDIQDYVDNSIPGNYAAKAAFDIALHDLTGKLIGQPWFKMWGLNPEKTPVTSFTIGIDTPEVVRQKVKEAEEFKILKVKLGRDTDKEMVETIRSITNVPICADANQGWTDKQKALDMCHWLAGKGVVFVEQPMPKTAKDDLVWLTQNSPLPIIGDEGVQTLEDVVPASHIYSGINIKLMKCGGLRAARKMITLARALNLKVMIGCMTETSCAVSAAAQLSPLVDWADLDGNLLISNDLFEGSKVVNGKVTLSEHPGIGIIPL